MMPGEETSNGTMMWLGDGLWSLMDWNLNPGCLPWANSSIKQINGRNLIPGPVKD